MKEILMGAFYGAVIGIALGQLITALLPSYWLCHKCCCRVGTVPRFLYSWAYARWSDDDCPHCKSNGDLLRGADLVSSGNLLLRAACGTVDGEADLLRGSRE